jgi:HK97 family phage major capsid protein
MSQDRLIGVDEDAIEQNFDEGQKNTILRLVEDTENGITNAVDGALAEKLEEEGLDSQAIKALKRFTDEQPKKREFDDKFDRMHSIWKNNGVLPGSPSHRFSLDDLIQADQKRKSSFEAGKIKKDEFYDTQFAFEQPMLIPKVVSQIVRDAIEPTIALTPLLQRINFQVGTSLTFPAMGAFAAADIPEGGEYPEQTMEFAGQVTATIGKSGVAVKFTDEMLRYSLFDVMSMHLRAAGRALIRHKEQKVANMITTAGTTYIDNTASSGALMSTGRGIDGVRNGTITIEDIFRMYASMVDDGYVPNAIIMHPFGWLTFALNPQLRAFGFANNGEMFQNYAGSPGSGGEFRVGGLNQETKLTDPSAIATTSSRLPAGFPASLNIIVSPFVPYDATNNKTEFWMVDTNELGVLVVDEDVVTEEFDDPARDIRKIKLRERYAVENINNGQAIRTAKGIVIDKSIDPESTPVLQFGTGAVTTALYTGGAYSPS